MHIPGTTNPVFSDPYGSVACQQSSSTTRSSSTLYAFLRQLISFLGQCQAPGCRDMSSHHVVSCDSLENPHVIAAVEDVFYLFMCIRPSASNLTAINWTIEATSDSLRIPRPLYLSRCPSLEVIVGEDLEGALSPRSALLPRNKYPLTSSLRLFPSWKQKLCRPWQRALKKVLLIVHLLKEPFLKNEKLAAAFEPTELAAVYATKKKSNCDVFTPPLLPTTHIDSSRWLELLDIKHHRNGGGLKHAWDKWMNVAPSIPKKAGEAQQYTKEEKFFFSWLVNQKMRIPPVKYLSSEDRFFRTLYIHPVTGVCSTGKDKILHTQDVDKPYTFVWDPSGNIIIGIYNRGYSHHSDGVAGSPVLAAGTAKFKGDGTPDEFTDKSGHFRISELAFIEFIYELKKRGVAVEHVSIILDCVKEPFTELRYTSGGKLLRLRERLYTLREQGRIPQEATPEEALEFVRSDKAGRISAETPLEQALQIVRVQLAKEEAERIIFAFKKAYEIEAPLEASPDELQEFVRCFKEEKISLKTPLQEALNIVRAEIKRRTKPTEMKT